MCATERSGTVTTDGIDRERLTDDLLSHNLPLGTTGTGILELAVEPVLLSTAHQAPRLVELDRLDVVGLDVSHDSS